MPETEIIAQEIEVTAAEQQQAAPAAEKPATQEAEPKLFSSDYVKALRNESAGYRTTAKHYENALKKLFNIAEDEKIGNIDKLVAAQQEAASKAMSDAMARANQRVISAELRALDEYDTKLLAKVMDMSGVSVDDDGNVVGLKEAAEAAAKEYPAVLKNTPAKYAAGTGTAPVNNSKYTAEEIAIRKAAGLPID